MMSVVFLQRELKNCTILYCNAQASALLLVREVGWGGGSIQCKSLRGKAFLGQKGDSI